MLLTSPAAIIPLNEFSEFRGLCLNASSHWLKRPE